MRVSSSMIYQRALVGFQQQQARLSQVQEQLSSGLKYQRPSDNPAAMARTLDLEQVLSRNGQYQDNMVLAENRLMLEESTLDSANSLLQRVRELAVQAGNGALSDVDRQAIASEVRERFGELVGLANTVDAHGDSLFAGNQGAGDAVQSGQIGSLRFVNFTGDDGVREFQIGEAQRVKSSDSGADVFFRVPSAEALVTRGDAGNSATAEIAPAFVYDATQTTGDEYRIDFTGPNNYNVVNVTTGVTVINNASHNAGDNIDVDGIRTAVQGAQAGDSFTIRSGQNQDVFATMNKFITALEGPKSSDVDNARYDASISATLDDLNNALGRIDEVRTEVGGRLNALSTQRDQSDAYALQTERTLSDIRDLDYAEAISRLQNDLFVLQAAQQSFAKIQGNSLFNYL